MVTCGCGSPIASCVMHPGNTGTPTGQFVDDALWAAVLANLRRPVNGDTVNGVAVLTFVPPLTTAESATLADITAMTQGHISGISLAEYQALKPDLAGLRTYAGIASPTLVQTVSAVKAQSRILRALLRDG